MAYEQTLYRVVKDYIKPTVIKKKNRYAKWEYGYDADHDVVVISKTGKIGDIYEIGDVMIALPKAEKGVDLGENKWTPMEYPEKLKKIKSVQEWNAYPNSFQRTMASIYR